MSEQLSADLLELLGREAFFRLAEEFGGTRLYVPQIMSVGHEISQAIGLAPAEALSARYAPAVLRIPLAREQRARHYRAQGFSNARIARKLGMSESGIDRLFSRMADAPAKGSGQLSFNI
ncbi:MAG: hypothetical protein ACK5NN_00305 [Sphingomonadaceae bacterium]